MAVNLSFIGGAGWQFFDNNGNVLAGGRLYTYAAGTTTPQTTYTSRDGLTANTNPIILDSAGRTPQQIWSTEGLLYKYVIRDANNVLIRTWDNIGGTVVANDLQANLASVTDNTKGDALVGFRQSNTSGFLPGATARTVNDKLQEIISVRDFGAVGDGITDDTAAIQAAIDAAAANRQSVLVPGGPYLLTSTLNISCRVIGTVQNRFGTTSTFRSTVGAGVYAIAYASLFASLECVTLVNTGAGNGINAASVSTVLGMKDVHVISTYPLATGSGSIGVSFGSDTSPGIQAITCVFDMVVARNYDICFRMRYYSNSNIYRKFYALYTDNAGPPATAGYLVNGRGAHFDGCLAESNFLYALDERGGANGAEENVYTNFWAEGVPTMQIALNGAGSVMINPYGFVGGLGAGSLPVTVGAYSTIYKNRGPVFSSDQVGLFNEQGSNLVHNAQFSTGLGGLSWSSAALSGNTIYGNNSLSIQTASAATTITSDHVLTYVDLDVETWLRGKTITYACFGKSETGVNMSLRGVIRTAAGSNIQFATSQSFDTTAGYRAISVNIPTDPAAAKYIVFRIFATNVTPGTPSKAGEISLPMVYLGNKHLDVTPKNLTDGTSTTYGNLTFQGGGWNTAHPVLGAYHLWVDTTGDLRIKNGAPTSDTDGAVVGTQT